MREVIETIKSLAFNLKMAWAWVFSSGAVAVTAKTTKPEESFWHIDWSLDDIALIVTIIGTSVVSAVHIVNLCIRVIELRRMKDDD